MPDADQVLMRRFQEGDERAFELLVHKYQGLVLSLCRRYLGSRYPGVEDVAQQVFLRVFKGRQTYKPRAKVKTWLYQIAVNTSLNEIRRLRAEKNRRVASFTAVFGDGEDGAGPDFAAPAGTQDLGAEGGVGLETGEVAARVRQAVDQLPEQQRLALVLSRFHHLPYEDIAASMDTTIPAVKSLLMRARENLRKVLADLVAPELVTPDSRASASSNDGGDR